MKRALLTILLSLAVLFIGGVNEVLATTILFPYGGGTGWGYPGGLQAHTILIGNGLNSISTTSPNNSGYVLTSNGVNADPTFQPAAGGGGGSGNVSTSTHEKPTQIAFWTSNSATPALLSGSGDFLWDDTNKILSIATTADQLAQIVTGGTLQITLKGDGEPFDVNTGNGISNNSSGGAINFQTGNSSPQGSSFGGAITFSIGNATGNSNGGDFSVFAGSSGTTTGNRGGNVILEAGNGGSSANPENGGNVALVTGSPTGVGAPGVIKLQIFGQHNEILDIGNILSSDKTSFFPNVTGTIGVGVSTTSGQIAYWGGSGGLYSVATSSASCSSGVSCSGFTVVGGVSPSITNSSPLSGLSVSYPFSFANPTLSWLGLGTTSPFTAGQLTYVVNGNTITSVATSSASCSSGVSCSSFTVVGGVSPSITNTGVLSVIQNGGGGTAQTGALTLSTSSLSFNGLTVADQITNVGGTFTWKPLWSGTLNNSGLTNSSITLANGGGLDNLGTVALGATLTLAAQVSTSTVPSVGGLAYWTGNGTPSSLGTVATGTISQGTGITIAGTGYDLLNNITITNSSPLSGLTTSFPLSFANPTLSWIGLASSSNIAAPQVLYATGVNTYASAATSTVSCSSGISCTSFYGIGSASSITNTGVLSIVQTYGSAQTGALTFATSSDSFNGLNFGETITNVGGTFTFANNVTGTLNNGGLTNSSVTVSPGTGLTGGGSVALGSSITLNSFWTASGVNLFNNNTGKVGIGSSTPFAQLSISTTSQSSSPLFDVASTTNLDLFNIQANGNIGIATITPGSILSIGATGAGINFTTSTSTFTGVNGINITSGCFAINGVCVGGGGGSGTVTSISNGGGLDFTQSPLTTSGTITAQVGTSTIPNVQGVAYWTGNGTPSTLGTVATGTISQGTGVTITGTGYDLLNNITIALTVPVTIANGGTATTTGGNKNTVEWYNGNNLTNQQQFNYNGINLGLGTTTPWAEFSISTSSQQAASTSLFAVASTTNATLFDILSGGQVGINKAVPTFPLDVAGVINTDQYSSYDQNGNLLGYASSTNGATIWGLSAGGNNATTSSALSNITAIGYQVMSGNTGTSNTGVGFQALNVNTSGSSDTAIGRGALVGNTTGGNVTGVGREVLKANTTGSGSSAVGFQALLNNTVTSNIVAFGASAAQGTGSYFNQGGTYIGYQSGNNAASNSDYNTFLGYQAGYDVSSGYDNILLGANINIGGSHLTTGGNNICIGFNCILPSGAASINQLNIGNFIFATGLTATSSATTIPGTLTGFLGLATTSPFVTLDIASTSASANGTFGFGQLALTDKNAGANLKHWLFSSEGGNFYLGTTSDSYATSTQPAFSISNFGYTGIGTSSPYGLFSISAPTWTQYNLPLFFLGTSSDPFGQLVGVFSTTTVLNSAQNPLAQVLDSGVRFAIGIMQSYDFGALLDQLTVNGRINTLDWRYAECVGSSLTSVTAATANACGPFRFGVQSQGTLISTAANGIAVTRICVGGAISGDSCTSPMGTSPAGVGIIYPGEISTGSNDLFVFGTTTPVFETVARINTPNQASSTIFYLGFANISPSSPAFATAPTAGCYFTASSTKANWQALCSTSGTAQTIVDTGFASTSLVTTTGGFYRFRIETDNNAATFYMGSSTSALHVVAKISTNYPNTVGTIGGDWLGISSQGLFKQFDIADIKIWYKQPALNYSY